MLGRYVPVRLDLDSAHLVPGDRQALGRLVEAATWIDRIYWRQRSEVGGQLKASLMDGKDATTRELDRLLTLNFGPWDTLNDNEPFWGLSRRPPGGSFYPEDLSREELEGYLRCHPEERASLLDHKTLIRRNGDRLIAVRFEDAYRAELDHVARALAQASTLVSHPGFARFLRARAEDLVSGQLERSEAMWIEVGDSPIDIAIGPYEVYDDGLLGVKAAYEATVLVRHPSSARVGELERIAPELERELPGAVELDPARRRFRIGMYDVAWAAGMTNMGAKAVAAMLPNDERIRMQLGGRMLLFNNVIAAKFQAILAPLAARLLAPEQLALVREDAFIAHTLLHEATHALSTCFVRGNGSAERTINDALRERYSTIEECRADLLGLSFLALLTQRHVFPDDMLEPAAVTFVANAVRSLRFGVGSDYARGAAIALAHLKHQGAIRADGNGYLRVNPSAVHEAIRALAGQVQAIATRGDYQAAGDLIERFGVIPPEVAQALPRFTDVPTDLEFVFTDSALLDA